MEDDVDGRDEGKRRKEREKGEKSTHTMRGRLLELHEVTMT